MIAETYSILSALFTDIADAIREKTGETASIIADDFSDMIRDRLEIASPAYLTFSSPNRFTLAVKDANKHWDGTLEYSMNTFSWSTWDGKTTLSSAVVDETASAVTLLSAAPEGRYLKISAAATAQSGSVTTNAKCVSTEGYIVASTQTLPITETVTVGVTNAADKFIKIYNGELVETD